MIIRSDLVLLPMSATKPGQYGTTDQNIILCLLSKAKWFDSILILFYVPYIRTTWTCYGSFGHG